jgi:uncharacterized protein YjgD (DUF1641 family)
MAVANGVTSRYTTPAEQLLDRLNEPGTAEALNRLLDHAELLAYSATSLDGLLRRGEELTDNLRASIDEARHAVPTPTLPSSEQVGQFVGQLPQLLELTSRLAELSQRSEFVAALDTLSNPATLSALDGLLRRMDLLLFAIQSVEALLARGEELADNVHASLQELKLAVPSGSIDPHGVLESLNKFLPYIPRLVAVAPQFIEVIERLEQLVSSEEFDALLNSGVFDPQTVALVGRTGDAFVASYNANRSSNERIGLVGLLRALRDPDIQRAAALVTDFGRRFGKTIK